MQRAVVIGTILFGAAASSAAADCRQSSLSGTWVYSAINLEIKVVDARNQEDRTPSLGRVLLERCTFEIDGQGALVGVACDVENSEAEFTTGAPGFVINRNCSFALFTIACDYVGQISADRSVASGVATCDGEVSALGLTPAPNFFNLVKQ